MDIIFGIGLILGIISIIIRIVGATTTKNNKELNEHEKFDFFNKK